MDRQVDALERTATPLLGRDPRGDAPFTAAQRIANRIVGGSLFVVLLWICISNAFAYATRSKEITAGVQQERVIRDQRYLQELSAATAAGKALDYTCGSAVGLGANEDGPGSKWWDLRRACLRHWGAAEQ